MKDGAHPDPHAQPPHCKSSKIIPRLSTLEFSFCLPIYVCADFVHSSQSPVLIKVYINDKAETI